MGRLRFELRTNRLKAECSTAELATLEAVRALRVGSRERLLNVSPGVGGPQCARDAKRTDGRSDRRLGG